MMIINPINGKQFTDPIETIFYLQNRNWNQGNWRQQFQIKCFIGAIDLNKEYLRKILEYTNQGLLFQHTAVYTMARNLMHKLMYERMAKPEGFMKIINDIFDGNNGEEGLVRIGPRCQTWMNFDHQSVQCRCEEEWKKDEEVQGIKKANQWACATYFHVQPKPIWIDKIWLTANDNRVTKLAKAIHLDNDGRNTIDYAVLGDALEEAGCNEELIINHCRDTSLTHYHGCWLIRGLLGIV